MKQKEIHIQVGCADARDLSQIQLDAIETVAQQFREQGIEVEVHVIRAAGSFITPDVVMDIKRTFEQVQRETADLTIPIRYFVHIQTHGHFTEDSNDHYISHVHDLQLVEGSPLNCGMLNASALSVEIEKMIVDEAPEIEVRGKKIKVDNDTRIKQLLHELYAYDGYLAGDWIRSIDLLRTHPRHQRTILEKHIARDPELKVLGIEVTCGIMDYAIHSLIRVDDGDPEVPFWDAVQQDVRAHAQNERNKRELLIQQSQKQKPLAGLLCMSDPKMSSRMLAAQHYMKLRNLDFGEDYLPNTIFNMTGSSFDIPQTPFGPYVIAGFFYSVKYLGLKDQLVMGYDKAQTQRILQKISNDVIMSMIVQKFDVNLIPVQLVDLE